MWRTAPTVSTHLNQFTTFPADCTIISLLSRLRTHGYKSKRSKRRDDVLLSLNAVIEGLNLT